MTSPRLSWRYGLVGVLFVASVALVLVLNARASGAGNVAADPGFHLTNVAPEVGITFVHHGPTLDPQLDNIARSSGRWGRPSRSPM